MPPETVNDPWRREKQSGSTSDRANATGTAVKRPNASAEGTHVSGADLQLPTGGIGSPLLFGLCLVGPPAARTPIHPFALDRDRLRLEFDAAVIQLDQSRPGFKLTTDFYRRIGDSVFDAGYRALQDFVDSRGGRHCAPNETHRTRMHVVSAPVGSGKTSFGLAFVTALVRCASEDEGNCTENADTNTLPYGCLVVVNQIEKADTTFRELNALLPDQVAVWTTERDPNCKLPKEERKVPEPAAQFTKDDLQYYPVAVVTHAFFGGKGSRKARQLFHKGELQPRALTVIDERIEEVTIYDVALSSAQKVRETVLGDERHTETVGTHIDELIKFMFDRSFEDPSIERPTDEEGAWSLAEKLRWFATSAASNFVKAHSKDADVVAVFGFARALANGYAFIARNSSGGKATSAMKAAS